MKRLLLPVLILSALAVGCKPASLAGTYKGTAGDLTLSDNGEFGISSPTNPAGELKGKWKEEGEKVILTPETAGGKPIASLLADMDKAKVPPAFKSKMEEIKASMKEIDGTLDKDRKVITISMLGQTVTLTKEAK